MWLCEEASLVCQCHHLDQESAFFKYVNFTGDVHTLGISIYLLILPIFLEYPSLTVLLT